jgi:hypothetical protein
VTPPVERPLAQITAEIASVRLFEVIPDSLIISLRYYMSGDRVVYVPIDETDAGSTFEIDSGNNPDWDEAISYLTNGSNDDMALYLIMMPWSMGPGLNSTESEFLKGGLTGDMLPDLSGAEITRILLIIDDVEINIMPGPETEFSASFRITVMGII